MLNQRGGHVVFGVMPDGRITGQHVNDRTIQKVSAELRRIEPAVFPSIERLQVDGDRELVVVAVT